MAAFPNRTLGDCQNSLEDKARAALDAVSTGSMSDAEWQRARTRLMEFVHLLRGWELECRSAGETMPISESRTR